MEYLNEIIRDTECFFSVDDAMAKKLSVELSEHTRNKLYFNPTPLKVNNGITINGNYSTKNLRQSFFDHCIFDGVNYWDAGLAGSLFVNSIFKESNFTNTNFQSCDFRECTFKDIQMGFNYTRFSKSIFTNTVFENCIFNGALMNDTIFTNCIFKDCIWTPIAIENAIFKNTTIQRVKFKNMNFEFSTFDNVTLDDVKLPFPTIPYIFNGLHYLVTTTDSVKITSAKNENGITIEEYMENLDKLSEFYKYTHNYFPLANIMICKNMHKEAFACVINGINLSIELRRFRMLKNYCKQLKYINIITMHERQSLYRYILDKVSRMNFESHEYSSLNNYLPEVRQLLLDDLNAQRIEISLSTNIESDDAKKLAVLIDVIDNLLRDKCEYSIEMRHNSPWEVFIPLFADPDIISNIIASISLVFSAIQTTIAIDQISHKQHEKMDTHEEIAKYKNKLKNSNIIILNMTINNSGSIQITNTTNNNG